MEEIRINKALNFEKGSFEIRYQGTTKKDVDLNKINKLIEDYVENHSHNDMLENVAIIRTILDECEEKLLVISYQDEKGSELVKYDNGNLFLYEKSKKDEQKISYKIKYEPTYGIKLDYNNYEQDITDYPGIKVLSDEISEIMKRIFSLKKQKFVILDIDSKILAKIYKHFYNENPNFTDKDINIKVQTMMSILANFGISLGDNYSFSPMGKSKMPLSIELMQVVNKLYPYGELEPKDIRLVNDVRTIIEIVGENVRKTIENSINPNEDLITISKIVYAGRYDLSAKSDAKKLSEISECPIEEVESSIKLSRTIKDRINKELK